MKIEAGKEWNRRVTVTDIPGEHRDDVRAMEVLINYTPTHTMDIHKGVALDNLVIPRIIQAVNLLDALEKSGKLEEAMKLVWKS